MVGMVRRWMNMEGVSAEEALDQIGVFDAEKRGRYYSRFDENK